MQQQPATSTTPDELRRTVSGLAHLLPIQGPIGVFVHHNTLHAFQHMPFEEAVRKASDLFGAEPYMQEEQYRAAFFSGRIFLEDIEYVLRHESVERVFSWLDRADLRRIMMVSDLRDFRRETVVWELGEGGFLDGDYIREIYSLSLRHTASLPAPSPPATRRLRDSLLEAAGEDLDDAVHPMLIRLCGAFLDQGLAYWPMPDREFGFYRAFRGLFVEPGALLPGTLRQLPAILRHQAQSEMDAADAVADALRRLQVPPPGLERFLTSELLALPGWAGMMARLEREPELLPHDKVPCSLMDFLAVRLTLTAAAAESIAGSGEMLGALQHQGSQWVCSESDLLVRAARVADVARAARIRPEQIRSHPDEFRNLVREIGEFDSFERRRIWHLAYERRHERSVLGPLCSHRMSVPVLCRKRRPSAQVFFCIDEREESFRRHLEETAPGIDTFGAAGFFGVAVDYQGLDDPHSAPLCPVVIKPAHRVLEKPAAEHISLHARRVALRAKWGAILHYLFVSSRTLVRGTVSTAILGVFSIFPLAAHVLRPRTYSRLVRALNRWILPEPRTELTLTKPTAESLAVAERVVPGFTIEEKVERVAGVLEPAGLTSHFAPVVILLGHGSSSLNNPHESAYDCGACGGRRGGPNARLFAAMANHPEVRRGLRARGIDIGDDTWFAGGYHDTCSDDVEYFDLEAMPERFEAAFQQAAAAIDRARALNAHERSRRFESAKPGSSPEEALRHVQERAEHLAQPRPELGHCTNAVCIVGRRQVTRGLFLDRRAFLVSYDPLSDPGNNHLARLLAAVIPVCAGISLEYYFSYVDNERYGAGTKLPHNISGLVGVMNGHASDLRTGLVWQMVEIHEPVRILFNIETTPDRLMQVISANPLLNEFVQNRWIRLSTLDPETGQIHVYRNGVFELNAPAPGRVPEVRSSAEWYQGKREHLPVARVDAGVAGTVAGGQAQ